jgi:hypothetical protein
LQLVVGIATTRTDEPDRLFGRVLEAVPHTR